MKFNWAQTLYFSGFALLSRILLGGTGQEQKRKGEAKERKEMRLYSKSPPLTFYQGCNEQLSNMIVNEKGAISLATTNNACVDLFFKMIPDFGHKETGKYLDAKM